MADTIPGGYYIGTDGKPHDANGNPISVNSAQEKSTRNAELSAEELAAKKQADDARAAKIAAKKQADDARAAAALAKKNKDK